MGTVFQAIHDFGTFLSEDKLKQALVNLNPGFHFDVGGYHDIDHPRREVRQGVYYNGNHICAMDRGNIPEYKVWMLEPGVEDISWGDRDRYDDAQVSYMEILPTDPIYKEAWLAWENKRDGYYMDVNGRLFHYRCCRPSMTPAYIEFVGWRHTLHRILQRRIPGVTREALCRELGLNVHQAKFNEKLAYMLPNT